jgi:hypothetical protein
MKRIVLILLLSFAYVAQAQYLAPMNAKNSGSWSVGLLRIDSSFNLRLFDTAVTKLAFPSNLNNRWARQGQRLYIYNGSFFELADNVPAIDTTSLSTRINARVKYTDTAAMLVGYVRAARLNDTASAIRSSIPNISGKVNYSDTAAMLSPYLRKADTTAMLSKYLRKADTTAMLLPYARKTLVNDTAAAIRAAIPNVSNKVNYSDTAAMLAPYATDAQLALKLNIVDTANMRIRPIAGSNMTITGTYPNVTFAASGGTVIDTTSLSTRIDARVKYTDTASMLSPYYRTATATAALALKQNYTDTTTWDATKKNLADTALALRALIPSGVDTTSLSNRIDARVKYSDTASMLAPYLPSAAAATTYVPYTGATTNVNLGTHTISSYNSVVNHTSGSGVAASITKGGSGEALTVVKSSGSGNAASITGGVTLIDELHLNTDLADAYIASAANWNAKIGAGDTAAMLSSYLRKADTASLSTRIDARVKYSDTSAMLGGYLRKVDTASLSNRIDAAGNDWKLTGNAGTNASTNYVGTSDNVDVVLRRNNVEKLRIANASVSTADPLRIGTNSYNAPSTFALAANNWVFGSDAVATGQNQYRSTGAIGWSYISGGVGIGSVQIANTGLQQTNASGGYIWSEGGVERMRIINGNGNFLLNGSQSNLPFIYRGTTVANLFNISPSTNNVGIGTNAPNASALLDLTSTTQGLGLPSMTTTQQNAIATPKTGLAIYNSTLGFPTYYNGTAWGSFTSNLSSVLTSGNTANNWMRLTSDGNTNSGGYARVGDFRSTNFPAIHLQETASGSSHGWVMGMSSSRDLRLVPNVATNGEQYTFTAAGAGVGAAGISGISITGNRSGVGLNIKNSVSGGKEWNMMSVGTGFIAPLGSFALFGADATYAFVVTKEGSMSIGSASPNASAKLEIVSTTQGLLLPRMTTTQINAIATPAAGLTVYNTTLALICFYNGTAWQRVTAIPM